MDRLNLSLRIILIGLIGMMGFSSELYASSEAGVDVRFHGIRVMALYSVAVEYDRKGEDCLRQPECLLFDLIFYLQSNEKTISSRHGEYLFQLYQSSIKRGNYLAFEQDHFEGGDYRVHFDGKAGRNLSFQVVRLLAKQLGTKWSLPKQAELIRLYKCSDEKLCEQVLMGSFPSDEMQTGYCVYPGVGCSSQPITIGRKMMKEYFQPIEE